MTDEEKKAIKIIQKEIKELEMEIKACEENRDVDEPELAFYIQQKEAKETLLNLIRKQSKVIDEIYNLFYEFINRCPGSGMHLLQENGFDTAKCDENKCEEENCKECIKQYFYGKVERR